MQLSIMYIVHQVQDIKKLLQPKSQNTQIKIRKKVSNTITKLERFIQTQNVIAIYQIKNQFL